MQKLLKSVITMMILSSTPTVYALSMCDLSFNFDGNLDASFGFNINVDLIGNGDIGTLTGEYDTSDILDCGDQLFLRGMYSQVSAGRWKFVFATFEGEIGEQIGGCPVGLYEGFWEGSGASEGTVYFANGEATFPLALQIGECPVTPE